ARAYHLERPANSIARQRGYLMRQNTKIVVATERASHEEPRSAVAAESITNSLTPQDTQPNEIVNSSRKISQPTWTAEPWNSKRRRKSIRINEEQSTTTSAAPPLPGQSSAISHGLGAVAEDELAEDEAEELEDGAERGRLFVKVVGVKDLQLPFPQRKRPRELGQLHTDSNEDEKTHFALTLDNGLHCVKTAWLDLARNAPIGQEFELVVLNDLEFQLTLQMKMEKPKPEPTRAPSPVKAPASPKKQTQEPKRPVTPPSAYELVQGLVAKDGSFGRAYVSCSEYEKQAYGRPATVDVKCFNEWAMEEVSIGSHRSKKGAIQLQRRPPYEIGKLELQLLYVPKPKSAKDEDMPKSMNGAIRAMREAEEESRQVVEVKEFQGHLSQQGGDCPYWRRRFFKLVGTKLTAYHETTHQPRATINLAKAAKLIDDRSNLKQKETSTKNGGRRKSGFADDEDGMMMVEEGFRIRFQNGETIDFYAGSTREKEEWIAALIQALGRKDLATSTKDAKTSGWTDVVLKREKSLKLTQKPTKESKSNGIPEGILPGLQQPPPRQETRVPSRDKELPPVRPQPEHRQSHQGPFAADVLPAQLQPTQAMPPQQIQLPVPQASPVDAPFMAQQRLSGVGTSQGQMLPPASPSKGSNVRPGHGRADSYQMENSSIPRPGHSRTESFQTDNTRSQHNSPVK
ncbi:Bud site selection protein bud4, partial [Elasticomyces elasticus]